MLKAWIAQGAEYQGHWAFIAPKRPAVPTAGEGWARNADRPVHPRPAGKGRAEAAARGRPRDADPPRDARPDRLAADARRRSTPSSPTQSPDAYEKVVDRLLASPAYGERMALDWLDAARYADTHGYHIDNGRDMTRWREWVIDAFNQNMPFDQFTVEQLAGDLLPNATLDQKIASGFNRNHMINFEGGAIPEEYHTAYIVDRVNTTATVWLGLTVGCAQCHDHKYDPITQKEFYQPLRVLQQRPGEAASTANKGNAAPLLKVPTPEQEKQLARARGRDRSARGEAAAARLPDVDAAQAAWEKIAGVGEDRRGRRSTLTKLRLEGRRDAHDATRTARSSSAGRTRRPETYTFTFRTRPDAAHRDPARGAAGRHAHRQGPRPLGQRQLRADRHPRQRSATARIDAAEARSPRRPTSARRATSPSQRDRRQTGRPAGRSTRRSASRTPRSSSWPSRWRRPART